MLPNILVEDYSTALFCILDLCYIKHCFVQLKLVHYISIFYNFVGFFSTGLGYQGFTLYNFEPSPVVIGCGSDFGVESGLLRHMGLGIDRHTQQFVQSQVKQLFETSVQLK